MPMIGNTRKFPDEKPYQTVLCTNVSMKKPKTILLILDLDDGLALGDAIIHLPFIRGIKEWSPDSEIAIYPSKGGASAMWKLYEPYISTALDTIPSPSEMRFDWVFDLVGKSLAVAINLRKLALSRFYSTACRGLVNLPHLPIYHGKHIVRRHLGLLHQATGQYLSDPWPWPLPTAYSELADKLLPNSAQYVGVAPGAGNVGIGKRWATKCFLAVAKHFKNQGYIPVIFLGPNEIDLEQEFSQIPEALFPLAMNNQAETGVPSDPILTIALAGKLAVAVANCSGTGHMLALGGASLVSVFGPTNYKKLAPYCRKGICVLPSIPRSKKIDDVKTDHVIDAMTQLIAHGSAGTKHHPQSLRSFSCPEICMNS